MSRNGRVSPGSAEVDTLAHFWARTANYNSKYRCRYSPYRKMEPNFSGSIMFQGHKYVFDNRNSQRWHRGCVENAQVEGGLSRCLSGEMQGRLAWEAFCAPNWFGMSFVRVFHFLFLRVFLRSAHTAHCRIANVIVAMSFYILQCWLLGVIDIRGGHHCQEVTHVNTVNIYPYYLTVPSPSPSHGAYKQPRD